MKLATLKTEISYFVAYNPFAGKSLQELTKFCCCTNTSMHAHIYTHSQMHKIQMNEENVAARDYGKSGYTAKFWEEWASTAKPMLS